MKITTLSNQSVFGALIQPSSTLKKEAVEGFAQEMTRRAAQTETVSGAARSVDDSGLTAAITNAVDYVKDNFGDQAANTVMGIVTKRAGSGPLSEDTLGQGFVDALEFIDRNFGTDAGDQTIGVFNGELNQAINGYFQNGKNETFMAANVGSAIQSLNQASSSTLTSVAETFQGHSGDESSLLFDQAGKNMQEFLEKAAAQKGLKLNKNGLATVDPAALANAAQEQASASAPADISSGLESPSSGISNAASTPYLQRRRIDGQTGYNTSGLKPGMVLDGQA